MKLLREEQSVFEILKRVPCEVVKKKIIVSKIVTVFFTTLNCASSKYCLPSRHLLAQS